MKENFVICTSEEFENFLKNGGSGLLASIQRQYGNLGDDDLQQELRIAAAHAIAKYDELRIDVKLTTFVWECCQRRALMFYRQQNVKKQKQPIEMLSFEEMKRQGAFDGEEKPDNGERRYQTFAYGSDRDIIRQEAKMLAQKVLDEVTLTGTQWQVISLAMSGIPQSVIAEKLGFSQSKVSKVYNEALKLLRETKTYKSLLEA